MRKTIPRERGDAMNVWISGRQLYIWLGAVTLIVFEIPRLRDWRGATRGGE